MYGAHPRRAGGPGRPAGIVMDLPRNALAKPNLSLLRARCVFTARRSVVARRCRRRRRFHVAPVGRIHYDESIKCTFHER